MALNGMDSVVSELKARRPSAPPRASRSANSSARSSKRKAPTHQISDAERKKAQLVKELLDTEATYIHHLDVIIKNFMDPLSVLDLVSSADIKRLFGDIKTIRLVNQVLFDQLQSGDVAAAFRSLGPYLKTYANYARNYPSSQQTLERELGRRKFWTWLAAAEAGPGVGGLKLPALLITPIQRLPRYRLLLAELASIATGQEKADLKEVLEAVEVATELVNESVAEREAGQTVVLIEKRLDSTPHLLVPGRRFVRSGDLYKMLNARSARPPAKWELRTLFLFNDVLIYGKPNARNDRIRVSCFIPLRNCTVQRLMGQNVFRLVCPQEELYFRSHSHLDIESWATDLEIQIQDQRENRATLRKDSSHRMPMRRATIRAARRRVSDLSSRLATSAAGSSTTPAAASFGSLRAAFPSVSPFSRGSSAVSRDSEDSPSVVASVFARLRDVFGRKRSGAELDGAELRVPPTPLKRPRLATVPSSLSPVKEEDEGSEYTSGVSRTPSARSSNGAEWWREYDAGKAQSHASRCSIM